MTTEREDIRDALVVALQDIDVTHTYDRAGTENYNITAKAVEYLVQGPDQVDDQYRPYIAIRQRGAAVPEYFPGHWNRWTMPWKAYFYPTLLQASEAAKYTQSNGALADIRHALHKAFRVEGGLRKCITILTIEGEDTSEGDLAGERGFVAIDFGTVHWETTDA